MKKAIYNFKPEAALHQINHSLRSIINEHAPKSKFLLPITTDPATYIAAYILWNISPDKCRFIYLYDNHHTEVMDTIIKKMREDFFDENFNTIEMYNECKNLYNILDEVNFSDGIDNIRCINSYRGLYLLYYFNMVSPLLIDTFDCFSQTLGIQPTKIGFPIFGNLYYGEIIELGKFLGLDEKLILDAYDQSYEIKLIEDCIEIPLKDVHKVLRFDGDGESIRKINEAIQKYKPIQMKYGTSIQIHFSTLFDQI